MHREKQTTTSTISLEQANSIQYYVCHFVMTLLVVCLKCHLLVFRAYTVKQIATEWLPWLHGLFSYSTYQLYKTSRKVVSFFSLLQNEQGNYLIYN